MSDVQRSDVSRQRQAEAHHERETRIAKWRASAVWISAVSNLATAIIAVYWAIEHWRLL